MSSWINLHAIWNILAWSLLLGAGLPALFALGLLALNYERVRPDGDRRHGHDQPQSGPGGRRLVCASRSWWLAIAYGIYFIVQG